MIKDKISKGKFGLQEICFQALVSYFSTPFYMYGNGEIEIDELIDMKEEIKECKDEWLEAIRKYDDLSTSVDDIW